MADDLKNGCASSILHASSMKDKHEFSCWTATLTCSQNELVAAVAGVGNSADTYGASQESVGMRDIPTRRHSRRLPHRYMR